MLLPVEPLKIIIGRLAESESDVKLSNALVLPIPTPRERVSSTWLPHLQRYLDHSWLSAGRFQSHAAMTDNSEPPKFLWNLRVCLPLTQCLNVPQVQLDSSLDKIRVLVMRWQFRRLFIEFKNYLIQTYSENWFGLLTSQWTPPKEVESECIRGGKESRLLEN